jgi:hypothetical protein
MCIMSVISRLRKARTVWKTKAVARAGGLRYLRKKLDRFRNRILALEEEVQRLKDENVALRDQNASRPTQVLADQSLYDPRVLCICIVIGGIVSFRAVPRILEVWRSFGGNQITIPHFTSVIHWSLRAGIAIFNQVGLIESPWIAIIDCSIDVGIRKALVCLRVSLRTLQSKQGAIGLHDCECIGIKISTQWNGPLVKDALVEIFNKAGKPVAILKDGGTDLNKGVELYREAEKAKQIWVLDDVGHVAANALKAEFAEQTMFLQFLEIVRKGATRIRQTTLAWLLPPKIRTKGRFQGITELAEWAYKLLDLMGGQGRAKDESELNQLRKAFCGLAQLRSFLDRFCSACGIVEKFLKVMKQHGLNQATYKEARAQLEQLPESSKVRMKLSAWIEKHLLIQCRLGIGQMPLLVSSDVIESLFGKFKTIIQRNPQAELNRLIYIIPLLCGVHDSNEISRALLICSHRQMLAKLEHTIPLTLRQQRHRELDGGQNRGPETGTTKLSNTG